MSHRDRLLLQSISLLSQQLPRLDAPYGNLFKVTSCVNPEEREIIGILMGISNLIKNDDPELAQFLSGEIVTLFEMIGIAKWPRTELTDLGTRVGEKYKVRVRLPDMPQDKVEGEEPWKQITEEEIIEQPESKP